MNVALVGPAGYDFQDLTCIHLTLRFLYKPNLRVYAELSDSEDIKILFDDDQNGASVIEVQVKRSQEDVELKDIANYLVHFPNLASSSFLLERIFSDSNKVCLFVVGGRCADSARKYAAMFDWTGAAHSEHTFIQKDAKALIAAISAAKIDGDPTRKLYQDRAACRDAFAAAADKKVLPDCLRRIVIQEQVTDGTLYKAICDKLLAKFQIPPEHADAVIRELREKVKYSKHNQVDFAPLLRGVVEKSAGHSINSRPYFERGSESEWISNLAQNRVLLLSGPPKCGKSRAAEFVALYFQKQGYQVETGHEVAAAARFLGPISTVPRLYVLDDPFGSITRESEARNSLTKLKKLVSGIDRHCALVVTQREDVLFDTTGAASLAACSISGRLWVTLDTSDVEFLFGVWSQFASEFQVADVLSTAVEQCLRQGNVLEVGSLQHLASIADTIPTNASVDTILRLARQDALELGAELSETPEMANLLSALAVSTGRSNPIKIPDLAYILSDEPTHFPAWRPEIRVVNYARTEAQPLPTYRESYDIPQEARSSFDQLERKRYLNRADNEFNFSHPFYRAAAESILSQPITRRVDFLFNALKRAIFCLSPSTSTASARNFDKIFELFSCAPHNQTRLVQIAAEGFNHTIFVNTRDVCYRFLVSRQESMDADMLNRMPVWSKKIANFSLDDVHWVGGEAWLSWGDREYGFQKFGVFEKSAAGMDDEVFDDYSYVIPPETASRHLAYVSKEPQRLSMEALRRLLSFDEAVIRGAAARSWISIARNDDNDVLDQIFGDEHPHVILQVLEGVLDDGVKLPPSRFDDIVSRLQSTMDSPVIAAVVLQQISLFDDTELEYGYERSEKSPYRWRVFSELFPKVLSVASKNTGFNVSRFGAAVTTAIEAPIPIGCKEGLLNAWLDWLRQETSAGRLVGDFSYGVFADLLLLFRDDEQRRLFYISGFHAVGTLETDLVLIQSMVRIWDSLSSQERSLVISVLQEESDDKALRYATALINDPPAEVLAGMGYHFTPETMAAGNLIESVSKEVLHLAISLCCREHSIADSIGISPNSRSRWYQILALLAARPEHAEFSTSFKFLRTVNIPLFNTILTQSIAADRNAVFDLMWRMESYLQGLWNPQGWAVLFDSAPSDVVRSTWMQMLTESAPTIIDNVSEIELWLGEKYSEEFRLYFADWKTLSLLQSEFTKVVSRVAPAMRNTLSPLLKVLIFNVPPVLPSTYDLLIGYARKIELTDPELFDALTKAQESAADRVKKLREDVESSLTVQQ